jgi:hypothetical protein
MGGYVGKILYVNLSDGSLETKPFPDELKRNYLGGRGLGIRILLDMIDPYVDPLGEKNVLIFAAGPLTDRFGARWIWGGSAILLGATAVLARAMCRRLLVELASPEPAAEVPARAVHSTAG